MSICDAPVNMQVRIYDNGTPQSTEKEDHNDDYLAIYVFENMDGCEDVNFPTNRDTHISNVTSVGYWFFGNGNGDLRGDVSSLVYFRGIANTGIISDNMRKY